MNLATLLGRPYLPHARRTLKPRTIAEYARLIDKVIAPALGAIGPESLTLERIEQWHAGIRRTRTSHSPVMPGRRARRRGGPPRPRG